MPSGDLNRARECGLNMDISVPSQVAEWREGRKDYRLNLSWFLRIETVRGGVSGPASAPSNCN